MTAYYDYRAERWVEQTDGEREIIRCGSDGTLYYADESKEE